MTRLNTRKRRAPDIGLMRHTIIVCTTVEKPDLDVSSTVTRPGVFKAHARVLPLRGDYILNWKAAASYEARGASVPTHEITLRTPPDVKIDMNHWIYFEEGKIATWFKVVTVEDLASARRFTVCLCAVDTVKDLRSDPATQPLPPVWETPTVEDAGPALRVDDVI